jgi:tetratricopeptide (TPR) repeat protein
MVTLARRLWFSQRIPFLLLLMVAIAGAASWKFSSAVRSAAGEDSNLAENFFPQNFVRMGATTDQTIQTLQARLKEAPNDWQSYSLLGLAYLQKVREIGDPTYYQKVEQAFQTTLANNPEDYNAVGGMGTLELARHQFQAALEWGQRAYKMNPNRSYGLGIIADAQIELGRYEEAVKTLQTMVDLRPDMSSFSRVSYIRELYGNTDQAIEAMQMAADAGEPQSENTAWTRTQLGNLYFNSGNLQQAEIEYLRTLQGYPKYIYALAGLGRVRVAQGKMQEAADLLTQASQKIPIPDFLVSLADIYQVTGQKEAAQREYDLLHVIQKLYQANGVDMDAEIALFNADHGFDPPGTVDQARKAYARRPSIYAADVLAWSLYQTGNYQEAQTYSQKALRLGTRDALKLFHAGMISLKLGDRAKARSDLEQTLSINPYFSILYQDEARNMLDSLKVGSVTP